MLCSSSSGKQHKGALPNPVTSCNRYVHQMVERKTCSTSNGNGPWSLTPNLQQQLKQFLRKWHLQVLPYQVPCHTPSFKMVFIKHAAVLDQLCNHKQAIADWFTTQPATCCCKKWEPFKTAALNPSDPHWVLAGSLLHSLVPEELAVIAEGSLLNKVFPSKKEYQNQLKLGLHGWTKRNGLPSMPNSEISDFSQHLWTESIPNTSLVTSPNHPSTPFKKPSRALSSIVKTNKPLL